MQQINRKCEIVHFALVSNRIQMYVITFLKLIQFFISVRFWYIKTANIFLTLIWKENVYCTIESFVMFHVLEMGQFAKIQQFGLKDGVQGKEIQGRIQIVL